MPQALPHRHLSFLPLDMLCEGKVRGWGSLLRPMR